jgi:4-amino-4-deoxy-L-arabinose transferase-like glycosyltransferase
MTTFLAHKKQWYAFLIALVLLSSTLLLLYKLGHEAFYDYDEATYAEVTHESLAHGNYFSLTYLNTPYFRKPPLLFWLTDTTNEIIPNVQYATRLPSAIAALLLIGVVMLICFEASGSMGAALLGGILLATTSAFMESAREVRFDTLAALFISATFYAFIRALRSPHQQKWYLAAGVFFGLAVLAKDVLAIFAGVAVLAYVLLERRSDFIRNRYFWGGAALALLIVLPWHLYETLRYGDAFWDSYIGTEVFSRVATNIFGAGLGPTNADYLSYFFTFPAPWTELFCVLVVIFPFIYKKADVGVRHVVATSFVTIAAVLLIIFSAHTKALSYLIPIYPFMAIAIALMLFEIWKQIKNEWPSFIKGGLCIALLLCVLYAAWFTVINTLHINVYYLYQVEYSFEEMHIGELIKASGSNPMVYTYNDSDFGTILYYSQLPATKNQYIDLLSDSSTVVPGSLVFTNSSAQEIAKQFPDHSFTPLYQGAYVSLLRINH